MFYKNKIQKLEEEVEACYKDRTDPYEFEKSMERKCGGMNINFAEMPTTAEKIRAIADYLGIDFETDTTHRRVKAVIKKP